MSMPLLEVRNLHIAFGKPGRAREVVKGVDFTVSRGEILAIVGESGSGKSVTALSLLGLLPKGLARVTAGEALFEGSDLLALDTEAKRRVRGDRISMIFQEPMTSLNPVLTIGRQLVEGPMVHQGLAKAEAEARAVAMLERVGIPEPKSKLRQYPHEFSGGMRQRVMIAMAMMLDPALIIADEPTTALDVTIQAQILDLMRSIIAETGTSLVLITHDMGVVAEMADKVAVMRDGQLVEFAGTGALFAAPKAEYTKALLAAVPRLDAATRQQAAVTADSAKPVARIEEVSKSFAARGANGSATRALDLVSLDIMPGETVGLVGESGSGKSTLGRALTRLMDVDEGAIEIEGADITRLAGSALRKLRAKVQMIFQDPYSSLDPRFPVGRTVAEPIVIHGKAKGRQAWDEAVSLLERVGLPADMAKRFPHEFSGGQRQRVAIARALAAGPKIIVADEPTSALDVSIQAQVLDLLAQLRDELGIALLFISHDMAVVRQMARRVAVMRHGRILELGPTEAVLEDPRHAYTRALLSAVPIPDPEKRGRSRLTVSPGGYPTGPLHIVDTDHWAAS